MHHPLYICHKTTVFCCFALDFLIFPIYTSIYKLLKRLRVFYKKEITYMKFGHFDDQNKEYVITSPRTPLPWINYLGCENFFSLVSNTCGGYKGRQRMRHRIRFRTHIPSGNALRGTCPCGARHAMRIWHGTDRSRSSHPRRARAAQ